MTTLAIEKWGKRLATLALFALMVPSAGCSRGEVELKNTVTAYNKMLSEALAKPDSRVMEYFTAPPERERIDAYITFLRKDKKVLVSTLKKLEFTGVERDKAKEAATVMTSEEWMYQYVDEKSRQPITKEEAIGYHNVYHLVEVDGHWVVEKVSMSETPANNP
jgi:hypothetical protein